VSDGQVSGDPSARVDPKRSSKRVAISLLFLVLALVLFCGALYYVGGIDYLMSLFGKKTPAVSTLRKNASQATTSSVSAAELESASQVYAEQIESQGNIDRLSDGDIASFTVDKIKQDSKSAIVSITARFKDGTSAPGDLRFVHNGELWYFLTITGLRPDGTGGLAGITNSAESIAPTVTADEKLAEVGVITPDEGVVRTIAEQQLVNQPIIRDLLSGEYELYTMGKPVTGPSTFTIPVTITSSKESTVSASVVVISKYVEGKDSLFITTFKKN